MTNTRTPAKIIPRAFPGIKPEEVQEIITNSRIQSYPPETIVCRENEIENTFYMILEGDFEVSKVINNTEIRILKSLTAGPSSRTWSGPATPAPERSTRN